MCCIPRENGAQKWRYWICYCSPNLVQPTYYSSHTSLQIQQPTSGIHVALIISLLHFLILDLISSNIPIHNTATRRPTGQILRSLSVGNLASIHCTCQLACVCTCQALEFPQRMMIFICSSVFSCDILSHIPDLCFEDLTRVGLNDKTRRHIPL